MAILGNQQGVLQQVPIFNYEKTGETAKTISVRCDFALDTVYAGNLSQERRQGVFQSIRSIYFDCSQCANDVEFLCVDTGQTLTFEAGRQGYLPVLVSQGMSFRFVGMSPDVAKFNLLNIDMPPAIWPFDGAAPPFPFSDIEMTGPALLGRYTAGLGAAEEIQLGAGLSFVGDTLTMGAGGPYVLKAGDTMTGVLNVNLNAASPATALPGTNVYINGADASPSRFGVNAFGSTPQFYGRRANTSGAAPSSVLAGEILAQFAGGGYGTTTFGGTSGSFLVRATENFSDTTKGTKVVVSTTPNGGVATTDVFEFGQDGSLSATTATGVGTTGNGTVNAVNYFDDGVNINTIYAGLAAANVFTAAQTINSNTSPPVTPIVGTILHLQNADNTTTRLELDAFGTGLPSINMRRALGTAAAPSALTSGSNFFAFGGGGYQSAGAYSNAAFLLAQTTENWTATALGCQWLIQATANGSAAAFTSLTVGNGVVSGAATGGAQGAGTLNATSLYANANIIADTNGLLRARVFTVGTLPAAVAGGNAQVSDATQTLTSGIGAVVAGGGANNVPVNSDGANWRIG